MPHIRGILQYLSFGVRLISFSRMFSTVMHVPQRLGFASLRLNNIPLHVSTTFPLSVHLLMGTWFPCLGRNEQGRNEQEPQ